MLTAEQRRNIERHALAAAKALEALCKDLPADDPDWFEMIEAYSAAKRIYEAAVCARFNVPNVRALTHGATEEVNQLTPVDLLRSTLIPGRSE